MSLGMLDSQSTVKKREALRDRLSLAMPKYYTVLYTSGLHIRARTKTRPPIPS